jgi:hypothetical protein
VKNKVTPSKDRKAFDGKRFQLLRPARSIPETRLVKSPGKIRKRLRFFTFGFINLLLLCLGCVLLGSCANDSLSDDSSQRHQHHRGGGQGGGGGGGYDHSGASPSATPIPGL